MPLFLDTGYSVRSPYSDGPPCLIVVPNDNGESRYGVLAALAAGVGERPEPDIAAHVAVTALSDSYYASPEGWKPDQALAESFEAAQQTLRTGGERGRASALSALVIRHRHWHLGHVGHTRLWRYRDRELKLLTRDHIEPKIGRGPRVTRACGLDGTLSADFAKGELAVGDIFVITGNGVHDALDSSMIMSCLVPDIPTAQMAECLTSRAVAAGGSENVAACVVRVESLPPETDADLAETLSALPALPPPEPGDTIDGFRIEQLLYKSRAYRLYRATDTQTNGTVALKVPNPKLARDKTFAESFLREEWIGKRVGSAHLVRMLPLRSGRRTALYSVLAHHEGENLAERIRRKRRLSVKESVFLAKQLLQALDDLHRHGVIHRDVRPKNILYDRANRHLLLLGLGSARVGPLALVENTPESAAPTNLSFLAPECFAGQPLDERADVYAAGVTLYHMLTHRYPYGKIDARESPPGGAFLAPSRFDVDVPPWLEEVLERACATDPGRRYQSAGAFAGALAEGSSHHHRERAPETPPHPVHPRHVQWLIAGAALLALLLYLMFILRR